MFVSKLSVYLINYNKSINLAYNDTGFSNTGFNVNLVKNNLLNGIMQIYLQIQYSSTQNPPENYARFFRNFEDFIFRIYLIKITIFSSEF